MAIDLEKIAEKEFDNIIDLSKIDTKIKIWYDTGIYSLNYTCSKSLFGGIPVGRVTSIDGLTSTGKSLLVASVMKDPKIDYILLIETEGGGVSPELFEFAGVNMKKIHMIKAHTFENYRINKANSSIEEISDSKFPSKRETEKYVYVDGVTRLIKRFVNTIEFNKVKKNILIVLDSLGNLQSVREFSGTQDMGAKSKAIATFFRTFDVAFEKTNIAFVFTNKLYTNFGNPWEPYKVSGGVNVEFNPSLSLRLSTTSETDDVSDKEMKNERDRRKTALGSSLKAIKAQVVKSRFGTELRTIHFLIDFAVGPAKYSGLFGLCRDFGLIERRGSSYTIDGVIKGSFYKKDFIKKIKEDEKNILNKIQKKLEEAEKKILTKNIEVNDIDEVIEKEEDYHDMVREMGKDADK